jgi:hypothetical protein
MKWLACSLLLAWLLSFAGDCHCDVGKLEFGITHTCFYIDINDEWTRPEIAVSGRGRVYWWPIRGVRNRAMGQLVASQVMVPIWMLLLLAGQRQVVLYFAATAGWQHSRRIGSGASYFGLRERASWITRIALASCVLAASAFLAWWILVVVLLWLFELWAWTSHDVMPRIPFVPISIASITVVALVALRNARLTLATYSAQSNAHCPCRHCGYDLQGSTSGTCPECGRSTATAP